MTSRKILAAFLVGNLVLLDAMAADVPVGTVISAANYDQLKSNSFEGKTIASMVPEVVEGRIKQSGLTITLAKSKKIEMDPGEGEATRKYSGSVKFDPATREVTGYKAGIAFPEISMDDAHAGDKLLWNYYYNQLEGRSIYLRYDYLLIDGNKGLERAPEWWFTRYYLKGNLGDQPILGDGTVLTRSIIQALAPRDVRGVGLFTIRRDTPQVETSWAYIKSARRVRQVSGGAWMDPIGGTDHLNDDLYGWNARPSWYPKITVTGKRWILAIADAGKGYDPSKKGTADAYLQIDLKNPPYWNSLEKWLPKEVYVIEAIAPPEHPYSKKVIYMDAHVNKIYQVEMYDKQGKLWKHNMLHVGQLSGEDGYKAITSSIQGVQIDFKIKHASSFVSTQIRINPKGMKPDDISLAALEANSQ